ncbi:MAG: flagellar protein FlgN [Vallitalea sp.]|nr:flagellar protein FlgN [Vallitalea sp.]
MASLIDELITTLEQEKEWYIKLTNISQEKTDVIIKGDITALNELLINEQEMVSIVIGLEKTRETIIKDIAIVTNLNDDELTISKLANLLSNQKKENDKLIALRNDIKDAVGNLKVINDRNKILIKESLDYIDFTMNAIQSSSSLPNSNYQSKGNIYEAEGKSFFDAKQ